jgi:hypothetical protein
MPLKQEGIHPDKVKDGDTIYWIDGRGKGNTYVPFTPKHWKALEAGNARL